MTFLKIANVFLAGMNFGFGIMNMIRYIQGECKTKDFILSFIIAAFALSTYFI